MTTWQAEIVAKRRHFMVLRSATVIFDADGISAAEEQALAYADRLNFADGARVDSVHEITPAPPRVAELRLGGRAPGLYLDGERVE